MESNQLNYILKIRFSLLFTTVGPFIVKFCPKYSYVSAWSQCDHIKPNSHSTNITLRFPASAHLACIRSRKMKFQDNIRIYCLRSTISAFFYYLEVQLSHLYTHTLFSGLLPFSGEKETSRW